LTHAQIVTIKHNGEPKQAIKAHSSPLLDAVIPINSKIAPITKKNVDHKLYTKLFALDPTHPPKDIDDIKLEFYFIFFEF
tara:strand:+ start:109 stop:348 length:240 start_codon:yes stop_codon:yes gene_type:complete